MSTCTVCNKKLSLRPVICTQCRKIYCSSKCKKIDIRPHRKLCKYVPGRDIDASNEVSWSFPKGDAAKNTLGSVTANDVGNDTTVELSSMTFVTDDGKERTMMMRTGNAEFIYGDIAKGHMGDAKLRVHPLSNGQGWIPIMDPDLAISKFREFYATNCPSVQQMRAIVPEDKTHGWLLVMFNDFEHFADCILGSDLSTASISWEIDDPNNQEKTEVSTLLDSFGRQSNILLCQFIVLLPMTLLRVGTLPGDITPTAVPIIKYDCDPGKCILNRFLRLDNTENTTNTVSTDGTDVASSWSWAPKKKTCHAPASASE